MGLKKRILITGSNGLLGQKLVKQLKQHDSFELFATSKGDNRISDQSGYQYHSLDITNPNDVEEVFSTVQPQVVIHTAAMTNVDLCESEKELCRALNVEAVKHLVKASKKYDSHFIHLSTDFIFDGTEGPYDEEAIPNPLSFYGQSKLDSEKVVQASGLKWSIVRTIIVYGIVEDMSRSNIVLWAKSALEKKQKLSIVNDQYRTPVLAEDLALGCIAIAEKEALGVYNMGGKDFMSIVELVRRVADYYGLDQSFIEETSSASLNQAAKRPPKTGLIIDKARNVVGYDPRSFEEGIAFMENQLQS